MDYCQICGERHWGPACQNKRGNYEMLLRKLVIAIRRDQVKGYAKLLLAEGDLKEAEEALKGE